MYERPPTTTGMRVVQVTIPTSRRSDVLAVLEDRSLDYVLTPETQTEETELLQFPVPPDAVEPVLDALEDAGVDSGSYTVLLRAEVAETEDADRPSEQVEDGDDRIGHDEIRGRALELNPSRTSYYAMSVLSAVVATAGLLLNSPAIVVGSMVIAPQVGSVLAGSVGIAIGDGRVVRRGFVEQVVGLGLAIAAATLFGIALRQVGFVSPLLQVASIEQVGHRISPGFLSMAVGLCAGAAGALGLATALPVSLVGVMIAAALIPAAAAVGVGVAWSVPSVGVGAFVLLVGNVTAINLTGFLVLWWLGYRPTGGRQQSDATVRRQYLPTAVAVAVLLVALAGVGTAVGQQMAADRQVVTGVSETLERDQYADLEVRSVQTEFAGLGLTGNERRVTLVLGRPEGETYPALPDALATNIQRQLDQPVSVSVTYRDQQQSDTGRSTNE